MSINAFKNDNNDNTLFICVGSYSSILISFTYDTLNKTYSYLNYIENACYSDKIGINGIANFYFKNSYFLVTCSYDRRFRIYTLEFNNNQEMKLNYQGSSTTPNCALIHKIKCIVEEDSVFLFVGTDEKQLYNYQIL